MIGVYGEPFRARHFFATIAGSTKISVEPLIHDGIDAGNTCSGATPQCLIPGPLACPTGHTTIAAPPTT
jgi:hypothetical protein